MTDDPRKSETELEPLRSRFGDDPDMAELVLYFVGEMETRVGALKDAWQTGNTSVVRSLAHQLKGAGDGYGFPEITATAGALEAAIDTEAEMTDISEKMEALIVLCRRATA